MTPEEAGANLLKAIREDDEETAFDYLEDKNTKVDYEDSDKWTPLSWACCNGNEKLVKILLNEHNAAAMYLQGKEEEREEAGDNPFKKPKIASVVGRYTPLHWASYKGHYRIVWYLLKAGLSPLDIDIFGNTAVHQAAASGTLPVLECYLSRGVDMEMKNARGHTSLHLATSQEVKNIITKAIDTEKCVSCFSQFDFKNIRYYCITCKNFYCNNCSNTLWEYETAESEIPEKPVCRCTT